MTVRFTHHNDRFWIDGVQPRGWESHPKGYFHTDDPIKALPYIKYADSKAKAELAVPDMWYRLSGAKEILDQKFDLPAGHELRPYQEAAVYFLRHQTRAYLADDPGTGKTVMCCAAIRNQITPIRSAVIICPVNVLYVWKEHLLEWCSINAQVVLKGTDRIENDFVIMSFDMTKKFTMKCDLMIVDEAAKIKNGRAARTKAILGDMAHKMTKIWFLSGTPLPNGRPIELWPVLASSQPRSFPEAELGWWPYAKKYCGARKGRFGWDTSGAANLDELHLRLRAGFMMRRKKIDVIDQLPELTTTIVPIEGDAALLAEEAPYRAEYISSGNLPKVRDAGELAKIRHRMGLAKVDAAVKMAQDLIENGQKVVIFCHHIDAGQEIAKALDCDFIHGAWPALARTQVVEVFQETETPEDEEPMNVLVLNAAGQEGITLTAASNVIIVEADWVPGNNEQRIARCWRFGQDEAVTAQFLTIRGSLDEHILRQNMKKQSNIDTAIDGAAE